MNAQFVVSQLLNGVQFGVFLYLMAAGLTLVLGVMDIISLVHGSLFMLGAYFAAITFEQSGSFVLALATAVAGTGLLGLLLHTALLARLQSGGHLKQVLATFGLTLFFNEFVRILWGPSAHYMQVPGIFSGTVSLGSVTYPAYRLAIVGAGILVAIALWVLIHKTRVGMLIRAGATNRDTVEALGVNIIALNAAIFALGAALAGLAGGVAAPLLSVQSGMGDSILIMALVVIVLGGVGSSKGAFVAAIFVALVDTAGRVFIPLLFRSLMDRSLANAAGPAIASMLIYCVTAVILTVRPEGLFSTRNR